MTREDKRTLEIEDVVGFDMGGQRTKIKFGSCKTTQEHCQTLSEKDEKAILDFLNKHVKSPGGKFRSVGIALACTMAPHGEDDRQILESSTKFSRLAGKETEHKGVISDLEKSWERELGIKVFILNDGEAASLAVYRSLKDKYKDLYRNLMVVTLGKSIGIGFVFNGKHYIGPYTSRASHIVLDPVGDWCIGENHRGCWKTLAGHVARKKLALDMGFKEKDRDEGMESKDIYELARAKDGNRKAILFFDFYAERVARGIATIASAVPIYCVVIAGGVANAGCILMNPLKNRLRRGDLFDPDIAGSIGIKTAKAVCNSPEQISVAYGAQLYALERYNEDCIAATQAGETRNGRA